MIQRRPLRADVGAEILARVVDGRLAAGARINEVHLAVDLGISRTPLREAMLGLVAEGLLTSTMGRGFAVPPLAARELGEVLEALAVVEPAALRAVPRPDGRTVMELQNLLARARLGRAEPGLQVERWFQLTRTALDGCENAVLRGMALRLNRLTLRYLHAALVGGWTADAGFERWDAVVDALRRGDREGAAAALGAARLALARDVVPRFVTAP